MPSPSRQVSACRSDCESSSPWPSLSRRCRRAPRPGRRSRRSRRGWRRCRPPGRAPCSSAGAAGPCRSRRPALVVLLGAVARSRPLRRPCRRGFRWGRPVGARPVAEVPLASPKARARATDTRANVVERIPFAPDLARLVGGRLSLSLSLALSIPLSLSLAIRCPASRQVGRFSRRKNLARFAGSAFRSRISAVSGRSGGPSRVAAVVCSCALFGDFVGFLGGCAAGKPASVGTGRGDAGVDGKPRFAARETPPAGAVPRTRSLLRANHTPGALLTTCDGDTVCSLGRCVSPSCADRRDCTPASPVASSISRSSTTSTSDDDKPTLIVVTNPGPTTATVQLQERRLPGSWSDPEPIAIAAGSAASFTAVKALVEASPSGDPPPTRRRRAGWSATRRSP